MDLQVSTSIRYRYQRNAGYVALDQTVSLHLAFIDGTNLSLQKINLLFIYSVGSNALFGNVVNYFVSNGVV